MLHVHVGRRTGLLKIFDRLSKPLSQFQSILNRFTGSQSRGKAVKLLSTKQLTRIYKSSLHGGGFFLHFYLHSYVVASLLCRRVDFFLPSDRLLLSCADIRRDNRPELKKAGNLRYAFARTSGEAIVIFDADFCPRSDFLRETLPYLVNPSIGILQTPQFFRRRDEQTWVEKGGGASQEFFYRMVQASLIIFG